MKNPMHPIGHPVNAMVQPLRKFLAIAFVGLFLCWHLSSSVQSAGGDLDLTFGSSGKVTTTFGAADRAFAIAIQSDGKLVVAGVADHNSGGAFALARYNSDGSLDSSFGTAGKVTTHFRSFGDEAHAVAIQSDGKIVAAGATGPDFVLGPSDFALARYNSDGSLDASFGTGGKVTTDFFDFHDGANAVTIQSDGKIVVAGAASDEAIVFALARYNSDGTLDTSFDTDGKATTDFHGRLDQALIYSVRIQSDGKIVAAGRADDVSSNFGLARYNPDGSLDSTFGSGGKVTTDFSGLNDEGHGLVIQSDGKIVVAGAANQNNVFIDPDFALARYNPDGSLDPSFGSGGKVITDFNSFSEGANATALQADGKIVVAGQAGLGFGLARYNPDGSLDPGFGTQGKITTFFDGFCSGPARAFALAIQNDGKIVAAGEASSCFTGFDFALVRYLGAPPFDLCLQDDSNGGILKINSTTGDYQFSRCGSGLFISGTGTLIKKGSMLTLQHDAVDRRVLARVDSAISRGTASIQIFSLGATLTITDRNTSNNTCSCP